MAPSMSEKAQTVTDAASVRSTSTMSSLRALLPSRKTDSDKKQKRQSKAETTEGRAVRMQARADYMAMR
ncbi:hypothetical protein A1O1_06867 [Capronia coronata CBS 617.96]|uniref:Uncharacterized protein n=1 Tax=Capronia coronata CBS 617.96 TaxID=1182541 RepID=W9XSN5_9EURO|nr:uncharacterized protein A1O1_06867 [Capronia coronata CBS 617.96]EXJ83248.1 hypothetical protein A1O1_06867 [Capronia coronata CBS 617.96]